MTACECGHDRGQHNQAGNCWHLDQAGDEDCDCNQFRRPVASGFELFEVGELIATGDRARAWDDGYAAGLRDAAATVHAMGTGAFWKDGDAPTDLVEIAADLHTLAADLRDRADAVQGLS